MNTKEAKCFICDSKRLNELFELENYPAYIVPLPSNISSIVERRNLALHNCLTCGHFQYVYADPHLQKLIYKKYYSYYTVDSSESFSPHYRVPFHEFFDKLKKDQVLVNKENILEIGCSSGQQVNFLKQFANNYYGIDPSERIHLAIKDYPKDNFTHGYFPQDISNISFDVIVSQFNLEHINNVQEFMTSIYNSLTNIGVVIIQIPDIEDFRRNKQPNFLAHEHIQYFTKNTIEKLLLSQGFEKLNWGAEGPSLIVAAHKGTKPTNFDFSDDTAKSIEQGQIHKELFLNHPSNIPEKVIYYGVGPQLYWLLSQKKQGIETCVIFDDNSSYEGQGLPGFENIIQKPSKKILEEYKCVVLSLNRIYHAKVLEKLTLLKVAIDVYYIDQNGEWNINQIK